MSKQERRTGLRAIMTLAAMLSVAGPAKADQPPDHHGQIVVENVSATPAGFGDRSIVRFRIINEGREHAHLLGVVTPVATAAHIVGRISDDVTTRLESIAVRADSDLDLTSDHMWIELGPLTRDVRSGESIPLELIFVRSRLHVEAHVHAAQG